MDYNRFFAVFKSKKPLVFTLGDIIYHNYILELEINDPTRSSLMSRVFMKRLLRYFQLQLAL